jgi:drug/metabolite transporter (DMT)-like permease
MGMLRFFIAGVATFLLLKNIEKGVFISRVHAIRVVVLGVVGFGIQQILFLSGFHYLNASLAALLSAFTTAIMIVITSLIIRERMTVLTLAGVGIACLGMAGVVLGKGASFAFSSSSWIGFLLIISAGLVGGFMPLVSKELLVHYSSLRMTTWTLVVGALFFFPFGMSDVESTSWTQLPAIVWVAIVFTALGATSFTNILWNYGIANIGVVRISIYGYLPPILGVIMATLLLHEQLTFPQWCGSAVTMGGVVLSQYGKFR